MTYDIIYADPPWDYGNKQHNGKEATGSACSHYHVMSRLEMEDLGVRQLANPNCLLFLWATGPMMVDAIILLQAWGFKYMTVGFVWDKIRVNPGNYTMSQTEFVLIGKRGRIPQPRGARNVRQLVTEMRRKHSQKPEGVRAAIEAMFPMQRKVELFAREKRDGWDVWGNEVDSDLQMD